MLHCVEYSEHRQIRRSNSGNIINVVLLGTSQQTFRNTPPFYVPPISEQAEFFLIKINVALCLRMKNVSELCYSQLTCDLTVFIFFLFWQHDLVCQI